MDTSSTQKNARKTAYLWPLAALYLIIATPAAAQDILNKTILYSASGGNGQIYIAPGGNIYRSYQARGKGIEYKLGQTIMMKKLGSCDIQTSAISTGNTLTLDSRVTCPAEQVQSTERVVVRIGGETCQVHVNGVVKTARYGVTNTSIKADSCWIASGNQLPR